MRLTQHPILAGPRRWPQRSVVLLIVAVLTVLLGGAALGQASYSFDLACRSQFTAAGGTATGGTYAVTGALGVPIGGAGNSASFGLRAGFLPAYPTGAATQLAAAVPAADDDTQFLRLPILRTINRIVRGGC